MDKLPPCRYQIRVKVFDPCYKIHTHIDDKIHRSYRSAILWLLPRIGKKHINRAFAESDWVYTYDSFEIKPLDDGPYSFKWDKGQDGLQSALMDECSRIDPEEEYMWEWDKEYRIVEPEIADKVIKHIWRGKRVKCKLRYSISNPVESEFAAKHLVEGAYFHVYKFFLEPNILPFSLSIMLEEHRGLLFDSYNFDVHDEIKKEFEKGMVKNQI